MHLSEREYLEQAEDRTANDGQYSNFRELYVKFREIGLGVRESVDIVLLQIYGESK